MLKGPGGKGVLPPFVPLLYATASAKGPTLLPKYLQQYWATGFLFIGPELVLHPELRIQIRVF